MRLSIIVATTPKRRDLIKLLESIENQSYQPDEVLIVTDKNKSKSVARVLNNSFLSKEKLRLVESAGIGLSHARNRGVEATTGDICCFIDDDVVLENQRTLLAVKEAFEEDDKLGVYGVAVKPLLIGSIRLPDEFNWIYGCTDSDAQRPVGAFFAVRRELFNVLGLFNTELGRSNKLKFPMAGEETEFFLRIQRWLKLKIVLDRSITVRHVVRNRGWNYIVKRCFAEGLSKARFVSEYDANVERAYAKRYLKSPLGWLVLTITAVGYLIGRLLK